MAPRADHAALTVDTPEGEYTLEADWLVAADGGRSGIRSQLGLKLEGASYEGLFVIADIRIDLPLPHRAAGLLRPRLEPRQHHPDAPRAAWHLARGLPAAAGRDARAGAAARVDEARASTRSWR
jgi:3-(3-hydroxy-phenyl)propionate hydroxylase